MYSIIPSKYFFQAA